MSFDVVTHFITNHLWMVSVFAIVLSTLILSFLVKRFERFWMPKLIKTANFWDDAFIGSVFKPLRIFIWVSGILLAGHVVNNQAHSPVIEMIISKVHGLAVVLTVAWYLLRVIGAIEASVISGKNDSKGPINRTTVHAFSQVLRAAVVISAGLIALQNLAGVKLTGVLAIGGIGTLAVGLAAKDLLANFFGGLMIFLDRPFEVGDWIRSPDKDIEGTVENIGWRLTRIRTFEKRPLYVPNGIFSTISVENPSRMENRRIKKTVGIRYDDAKQLSAIISDMQKMITSHPGIDHATSTPVVNLVEFGPSSLDILINAFTKTVDKVEFHQVQEEILLTILNIIEKHGAECAFPTTTLHVPEPVTLQQAT